MTIEEFNEARETILPYLILTQRNPTPENLSHLMLKMALHGLVAVPFDHHPDDFPQPICAMIFIPTSQEPERHVVNTYLVPADQIR